MAHLGHIAIRGPLTRNRCMLYVVSGILIPFHNVSDQSASGRQPILHLFCDLRITLSTAIFRILLNRYVTINNVGIITSANESR